MIEDKNNFSELRRRAEEQLNQKEKPSGKLDPIKLEHELHVHEIELQMQNEELHSAQFQLVKSIKEYTELFNLAPVGYFILDDRGVITNVNIKGSDLIGIDKKQLTGKNFSIFLDGESCQDDYHRHLNLVIESAKLTELETEIRKKDGSTNSVLVESICVKDEKNDFKHVLSTVYDVSRRKEHELKVELALAKEKELSEMKSRFISMASHEFRTPLSTILSSASLIESYDKIGDTTKRKKHLDKIKASVDGLREILTTFFTFNQIDKKLHNNKPETFNLVRLTEETISLIDTKNHTLVYNHIGEFQDVYLDAKLLKICLSNLLSNAIKYSPKAGVIEITTEKNESGEIEISVKDYGIGIPENEKAHIFGQFFKANNADTIQGTGLGLNIIKKLITLMGGSISFESKINEGTMFVLKFPGIEKEKSGRGKKIK